MSRRYGSARALVIEVSTIKVSIIEVSAIALTAGLSIAAFGTPPGFAQAVQIEQVTVEGSRTKPAPRPKSSTATPRRAPVPRVAAPAPATAPTPPAQGETAFRPVDGYVATRTATGTKTDTPLKEVPQSITVVTRDRIRDQGAQTVQDALNYVPGVYAGPYGFDTRGDWALIRGFAPVEYLDGMRRLHGYYNNTRPDPYTLERIEVLRGPSSVLYGQGSTGGLVNMVSKRPLDVPSREVTVEYGTYNLKQVKTDLSGPLTPDGTWKYRIVGVARDADTQVDFVKNDRYVLAPSLTYQPTTQTTLTLLALLQKDKSGSSTQFLPWEGTLYPGPNGKVPSSRFVSEPGFDRYDSENKSVTALFQHNFDDIWTVRQNLRYTDSSVDYRTMYPVFADPNSPFVDPQRRQVVRGVYASQKNAATLTSDSSLEAKFRWGAVEQKVLAGVDYVRYRQKEKSGFAYNLTPFDLYAPSYGQPAQLHNGFSPIGVFPISGITDGLGITDVPTNRLTQLGTYLQDQIRLGPWIAVAGVRRDWLNNRVEGSADERTEATSRRLGLMYETPFGLTPYVSYSESFEPVSGLNFYNQRYKPIRGEQVEVGVKFQPAGPDLVINAAVYDLKEKNQLSADPINPLNQIQIDAHSRGFEFETLAKLGSVSVIATYSYTDARVEGGLQDGFRVATVPEHMASLWMKHDFAIGNVKGFSVGSGVRYVGSSWDGIDKLMTPAVTLFDAMFAYDAGTWRWAINGTNLADKEYVSTCLARGDCFFGNRRAITTSLTYRF